MLKVECDRWNESASVLREEALKADHARTRERLMALYEICNGKSATKVGRETGRNPQTVMEWVHRYNISGKEALLYQRTGGHTLFFPEK
ncbi:helix-turn-helix domain-containing protein [Nostoc sp. DedSLP03]|uniref:helix-turn-helix domain-containing protein n=1 Tax=Nostoc sp. DedSLP03 TaxID=3075400 RepID=UPI002AD30B83|nr:helix-turn-helix domain-containing protein [Nostoc sp. DedSLP03]